MLDFTATLELTGLDAAVAAAIRATTEQALSHAATELRHRLVLQFESEGAAYAPSPWAPRKRSRPLGQPHRRLLFQTGRLQRSFTETQSAEHIEERIAPNQIILGSATPYAAFHQSGTVRMPARPILTAAMLNGLELRH
jgi:phage gpG-like protein